MGKSVSKITGIRIAFSALLVFLVLCVSVWLLPSGAIYQILSRFLENPSITAVIALSYSAAFVLRAAAWKWLMPVEGTTLRIYLNGLLYSLFLNHVLPIKAGDAARAGYLAHKSNGAVSYLSSFQSVAILRVLDMLVLGSVAAIGSLYAGVQLSTGMWQLFAGGVVLITTMLIVLSRASVKLRAFIAPSMTLFTRASGTFVVISTTLAWVLESFVLYFTAVLLHHELSFLAAWWTTSVTIAGQVFHFSPGGIGTYEAVMTATLRTLHVPLAAAFETAVTSHAFKFIYSYGAGVYCIIAAPVSVVLIKKWLKKERA